MVFDKYQWEIRKNTTGKSVITSTAWVKLATLTTNLQRWSVSLDRLEVIMNCFTWTWMLCKISRQWGNLRMWGHHLAILGNVWAAASPCNLWENSFCLTVTKLLLPSCKSLALSFSLKQSQCFHYSIISRCSSLMRCMSRPVPSHSIPSRFNSRKFLKPHQLLLLRPYSNVCGHMPLCKQCTKQ